MSLFHAAIAIIGALVVGGALGYAFRGKIHSEIGAASTDAQKTLQDISKKL